MLVRLRSVWRCAVYHRASVVSAGRLRAGSCADHSAKSLPSIHRPSSAVPGVAAISPLESCPETVCYESLIAGGALVTVNQRLARHHARRFGEWQRSRGVEVWETPRILPWRAYLIALHDDAVAIGLSSRVRVPAVVLHRLWRRALEDEAGEALLDPDAAARLAAEARSLGFGWHCLPAPEDYLSIDQQAWSAWFDRVDARMTRDGLIDDAALGDHLADLLGDVAGFPQLPVTIVLAGFLQLTPQQQTLLSALAARGVPLNELARGDEGTVRCDVHADDDAELRAVAGEVREVLEADRGVSLGVVVADLGQRRAEVLRAFDRAFFPGLTPDEIAQRGRPYDVSLGLPLADQAVVRTALTLLRLVTTGLSGGELSALLLSPYVAGSRAEGRRRERLDRTLRERGVRQVSLGTLCDELGAGSELAVAGRRLLQGRATSPGLPSLWAARFAETLEVLGWPGGSNDSEEFQAIQAWHDLLQDLQMLDDDVSVTEHEASRIVFRLARERVFQPETANRPIQIMGRLESHGIGVDRLWVTGLDAAQWPPAGSPSPFLPMARQQAAGMPEASVATRLALAEREFAEWRCATPLLIASHASERDGNPLAAAAVLREAGPIAPAAAPVAVDPLITIKASAVLTEVIDTRGPPLPRGTAVSGGARLFENQALCPFRAFALHRLQVQPLEEVGIGLDPRQHGNLLHHALEHFWTHVGSHAALEALDREALVAVTNQAVERALDGDDERAAIGGALRALEHRRLVRLLDDWIERCERPRAAFEVVAMEEAREIECGGIRMNVRIDRVDRVGDAMLVLDYKTGTSSSIASWSDERITQPQLPLYVSSDDAIEGVAFAQVARHGCSYRGVVTDRSLLPGAIDEHGDLASWQDWRQHWAGSLEAMAREIRSGEARVEPLKNACRHCELKPLCRVDEAAVVPPDDEDRADTGAGA